MVKMYTLFLYRVVNKDLHDIAHTIQSDDSEDTTNRPDYMVDVYEQDIKIYPSWSGEDKGD